MDEATKLSPRRGRGCARTLGFGCLTSIILLIGLGYLVDLVFGTPETSTPLEVIAPSTVPPVAYTILSIDDLSMKAITQPLSSYTQAQLELLPMNVRLSAHASIDEPITREAVSPTLRAIIDALRAQNPDADEITVFLYSRPELVGQGYDIGTALWAPGGERGRVTPEIARSNNRQTYRISETISLRQP